MNSTKIEKNIKEENIILLSQIEVLDNEYEELKNYMKDKIKYLKTANFGNLLINSDIKMALALVQIAIRYYKDGNYWDKFFEEMKAEKNERMEKYLGEVFMKTLCEYNLFEINKVKVNGRNAYVENIKAHAFVTNAYIDYFFDFAYSFYENNLCRQIEDITEDIKDLSIFMKSKLDGGETFKQERGMASKSYRLAKSTREVFAYMNEKDLTKIFKPFLKMIDNWFFGSNESSIDNNKYGKLFESWSAKQETEGNSISRKNAVRSFNGRRPYLKIDIRKTKLYLIIPQQKFRTDTCDGSANAKININGKTCDDNELELYKSFGKFISEEMRIPLDMFDIFDEISVNITGIEKTYKIPRKNYRFFDENFCSVNSVKKGRYYLFANGNTKIIWQNMKQENKLPKYDSFHWGKLYNVEFNEFIQCSIDEDIFGVNNNVKIKTICEDENIIDDFEIYHQEEKITATRKHPKIRFSVEKKLLPGVKLFVKEFYGNSGDKIIKSANIKEIENVIEKEELISDASKWIVKLEIDKLLEDNRDGIYNIELDVPGKNKEKICKYCLLNKFKCYLKNKNGSPVFMYGDIAELELFTDNYNVEICDKTVKREKTLDDYNLKYIFSISQDTKEVNIILNKFDIIVKIPIDILAYSFSSPDKLLSKQEYIWYSNVENLLYVKVSNCDSVSASLGNIENKGYKEKGGYDLFRIDIEEIRNKIKEIMDVSCFMYLTVEHKKYGRFSVELPKILRRLDITPYFVLRFDGKTPYINVKISGDAELYLTVKDEYNNIIIKDKKITDGVNELPNLKPEQKYTFYPTMVEEDDFFDSVTTELDTAVDRMYIDPYNLNLLGEIIPIKSVIYKDEVKELREVYFIFIEELESSETYIGRLFSKNNNSESVNYIGKVKFHLKANNDSFYIENLEEWSNNEEGWYFPYYDIKNNIILSCDNKKITNKMPDYYNYIKENQANSKKEFYESFLELDNITVFYASLESFLKVKQKQLKNLYIEGDTAEMNFSCSCGENHWKIINTDSDIQIKCKNCEERFSLQKKILR